MSRPKHSGKAIEASGTVLQKRRAAAFGKWADSPWFELAEQLEHLARMRQWRSQSAESARLFAAFGGEEKLRRLVEDCQRRCVAQCLSAIRFDKKHGEIVYDASPVARLAEAIKALAELRKSGPVQPLHRLILDLLPDGAQTIGDIAPKLAKRLGKEDTDDFRRTVRLAVEDLGLHLKEGQRGRPKSEESSPHRS